MEAEVWTDENVIKALQAVIALKLSFGSQDCVLFMQRCK